jgi:hypothetical protein
MRMRWPGNEAHMRDKRLENLKGKDLLEYLDIYGRIRVRSGFIWIRIGIGGWLL